MSLQVLNAHTGARYSAGPESLTSLNTLRAWIAKASTVAAENQILLTAQGRQAKLQTLRVESQIFLYDRQLLLLSSPSSKPSIHSVPSAPFHPLDPHPDIVGSQNDLRAWQNLFRERQAWALAAADRCRSILSKTEQYWYEHLVVRGGLVAALENLKSHVQTLEQKHAEAHEWSEGILKEQRATLDSWEAISPELNRLSARPDFLRFIYPTSTSADHRSTKVPKSLEAFLSGQDVAAAASVGRSTINQLSSQSRQIDQLTQQVLLDSEALASTVEQEQAEPVEDIGERSAQVMEDIDVVASKVAADYEHILSLPATGKSLSQASKMALLQTRNYLPGIQEDYGVMHDHLQRAIDNRNASASMAIAHMQSIAKIQSVIATANAQLQTLDIPSDGAAALEALTLPSRLPLVYGWLLIEALRRQDWISKVKADSSTLAEEFAGYQQAEDKRRNRWFRTIDGLVNGEAARGRALGMDIHVQGDEQDWPMITREEVDEYLRQLSCIDGMNFAVKEMTQALKDIDRNPRHQTKPTKAFKMGSLHEAEFGKGSLLLRGDDELRQLKDVNVKLEDELRGQKSRVRKLEDLLHRQTQVGRTSAGTVFHPTTNGLDLFQPESHSTPQTPVYEDALSRRSSVASRRLSVNQSSEEKKLARRIVGLEAELVAQKEQRQKLEEEVASRRVAEVESRSQIDELNATKKDLMANMEAQQREFVEARRALEEDNSKIQVRLEEVEDELDRMLDSRDNYRTGADNEVQALKLELEKAREEAAATLVREQQKADEANTRLQELESVLQQHHDAQNEHRDHLQEVHSRLSADDIPPEDMSCLRTAVDVLVERVIEHGRRLTEALVIAKSENESLQARLDAQQADSAQFQTEALARENEITRLNSLVAAEASNVASLSAELDAERSQVRSLQQRFADGETGSEALQQRIADEESKVTRLLKDLSDAKSHVNSLDVELLQTQRNNRDLQAEVYALSMRLGRRSNHTRYLTERLYKTNSRLSRLLESLGFVVTYSDHAMVIQRVSKTAGASIMLSDPASTNYNDSVLGTPTKKLFEETYTADLLDWMTNDSDSIEDDRFAAYSKAMDQFDLDIFGETIVKRLRDMEHTARKWQKDARTQREKSHRAQSDAQEKIAFRFFKEGDLALFLPTRNQANRPWAAFNVGAPHYFLREQDSHHLRNREWLVARVTKIEERVVDLSKAIEGSNTAAGDGRSIDETSDGASFIDDDNPFELSDGLRWYLVDAAEERSGAPSTPGLGKSTVASAHIDARGSIRVKKALGGNDAGKALNKSLDSRRSSSNSKKGIAASSAAPVGTLDTVTSGGEGEDGSTKATAFDADTAKANEEERVARTMSPAKSALIRASSPAKSASPAKVSKMSLGSSPAKSPEKQKGGLWDTLWQFDYDSGKRK